MTATTNRFNVETPEMLVLPAESRLPWPRHPARQALRSRRQLESVRKSGISPEHHAATFIPRRGKRLPTLRAKVLRHRPNFELDAA